MKTKQEERPLQRTWNGQVAVWRSANSSNQSPRVTFHFPVDRHEILAEGGTEQSARDVPEQIWKGAGSMVRHGEMVERGTIAADPNTRGQEGILCQEVLESRLRLSSLLPQEFQSNREIRKQTLDSDCSPDLGCTG